MIPYSRQSINDKDIKAVTEALQGDMLTGGGKVKEFEKAICKYIGVKYAVVMNSATSALHVSFLLGGFQKDDEFITTPLTFAATSNAGLMVGAKPIFCDIKKDGNIDENKIKSLITKKTKAIVAVDFGGLPLEMEAILKVAKEHNLLVINDASHAFGSKYKDGLAVGTKADMSIFSFHAIKPITTFEGGALVTNDKSFYQKALKLRSHSIEKTKLWDSKMSSIGYNYRLSDVACALGLSQLKRVDKFIQTREKIALFYEMEFANNPYFKTIPKPLHVKHSRHLFPILLRKKYHHKKEAIFKALHEKGIGVQVHYKPLFEYELYKPFYKNPLPKTKEFYKSELSIPCHQGMNIKDARYVAKTLLEILEKLK